MRLSRAKILLVDADAAQRLTAAWLHALGVGQLTRAHDAAEAAEALERLRWDLLIVDCGALDEAQLTVLRDARARSEGLNRETPLILLAGDAGDDLAAAAETLAPVDSLPRPFDPQLFFARVSETLARASLRQGPEHFGDLDALWG
jgi:DNA-binding response OmpR family regulator